MRILIISATKRESECYASLATQWKGITQFDQLITGIGVPNTIFEMTHLLSMCSYDLLIHIGICGSFDRSLPLGETLLVEKDIFAEMGIDDRGCFIPFEGVSRWEQMRFGKADDSFVQMAPKQSGEDNNLSSLDFRNEEIEEETGINLIKLSQLKKVCGITVNTVTGSLQRAHDIEDRYHPSIESMEGAAFYYVCRKLNLPGFALRSVSNYVEERNVNNWDIDLAIKNLSKTLLSLFQ